ncbi:MAG: AAA family ATPase [Bacteroidales bacterium]|nr:AAA family ATPase [Bacteroidales bacterium]
MLISRIKAKNFKTYLDLDLDLTVKPDRPIVLVGGMNGGGKTTMFEAIYGALYGLNIKDKHHFMELVNNGASGRIEPKIELEITFTGEVLNQVQTYVLKRMYMLENGDKLRFSVMLNMNGNVFVYGSATPEAQRIPNEQQVNKIIKANLPQELSRYFLFDAMQSSELLEANVFSRIIKDNVENVMGFNKYMQLRRSAEKLQQEASMQRLKAQQEIDAYEQLCQEKASEERELERNIERQEQLFKILSNMKEEYDRAKAGESDRAHTESRIEQIEAEIRSIEKKALDYSDDVKQFVETMETSVFLPKIASGMMDIINGIIHNKEEKKAAANELLTPEEILDITNQVLKYLQDYAMYTSDIPSKNIAEHIAAQQKGYVEEDEYAYLETTEYEALKGMLNIRGFNEFLKIDRNRQDLNLSISNLETKRSECATLKKGLKEGNNSIINDYDKYSEELDGLRRRQDELKASIAAKEKKIHQYDVQIQQEPDVKYDTLIKLKPFFEEVSNSLLQRKKSLIETEMKEQLNKLLISYKGCIGKVVLSDNLQNFTLKLYHKAGNEISLNQLNAASKQIFIQVLLKVLRNLGDYNPPVMIDTVMGVLDEESREVLMEEYFPQLAEQTILLCTTSEIRKDSDYIKLEPFISKTYTLRRSVEEQMTTVENGYFGVALNND